MFWFCLGGFDSGILPLVGRSIQLQSLVAVVNTIRRALFSERMRFSEGFGVCGRIRPILWPGAYKWINYRKVRYVKDKVRCGSLLKPDILNSGLRHVFCESKGVGLQSCWPPSPLSWPPIAYAAHAYWNICMYGLHVFFGDRLSDGCIIHRSSSYICRFLCLVQSLCVFQHIFMRMCVHVCTYMYRVYMYVSLQSLLGMYCTPYAS